MEKTWEFKTAEFTLTLSAEQDYELDLSWDETGETLAALESGRFVAFVARVRLEHDSGITADDYLGGCIYESVDAFRLEGGYFRDMVRAVCADMRASLARAGAVKLRAA